MDDKDDFEGLIMALVYLKKEAVRMEMFNTERNIDSAIELAFIERYQDTLSIEELEKLHEVVEMMLYMPEELLERFSKL